MGVALLITTAVLAGPLFEDVTPQSGISAPWYAPGELSVAGLAWFDYDGDPLPDLLVTDPSGDALYRNLGGTGEFEPVALPVPSQSHAVLAADLLGDSGVDLLLLPTSLDARPVLLVRGPDGFMDWSGRLLLPRGVYYSATPWDVDRDGDLDIVLSRWANATSPGRIQDCNAGVLLLNDGRRLAAFAPASEHLPGCSLLGFVAHLDGDGAPDYLQINDFGTVLEGSVAVSAPTLDAGGHPVLTGLDHALEAGVFGMGAASGDLDGDGVPERLITSAGRDMLLSDDTDVTDTWGAATRYGVGAAYRYKWAARFLDVDNDGDEDLLVLAGEEFTPLPLTGPAQQSSLLLNSGEPPLADVAVQAGLAFGTSDRSLSVADFDADGRLDLAIGALETRRVLRNVTEDTGRWIGLWLRGSVSDSHAIGARVELSCGEKTWIREQTAGGSPGSSHGRGIHVGLGVCLGALSARVEWPSGRATTHEALKVNSWQDLSEPEWLRTEVVGDTATVWYQPPERPEPSEVLLSTTRGTATPMVEGLEGVWQGTVTSTESGEAILTLTEYDRVLPIRPRVRFAAADEVVWGAYPWPAIEGLPLLVSASTPAGDALEVVVDGNTATAGGATLPIVRVPLIDPDRSVVRLLQTDSDIRVEVRVLDPMGNRVAPDLVDLAVTLDGSPFAAKVVEDVGVLTAFLPVSALLETIGVSANGVAIGTPRKAPAASLSAQDVSAEQSRLRFFERHVVADGADHAAVWIVLRDAAGHDLPIEPERLSLAVEGGQPVARISLVEQENFRMALGWVQPDLGVDSVRVAVLVDGQPIGVEGMAPALAPSQPAPLVARLDGGLRAADTADPVDVVGPAGGIVTVIARDSAGHRVGAGAELIVTVADATVGVPVHAGYGEFWIPVAPPAGPCTAVVTIGVAGQDVEAQYLLRVSDGSGALSDRRCGEADESCVAGTRPGSGSVPMVLLTLAGFLWMRRRSALVSLTVPTHTRRLVR